MFATDCFNKSTTFSHVLKPQSDINKHRGLDTDQLNLFNIDVSVVPYASQLIMAYVTKDHLKVI